ncbi:MAG: glycine zipper 2TM domain-containing protein [Burkholderiales bacterium]|nr:glycine zipper 2TM domain-containing protein [Burkholderiales bacterium]
MKRVTKTISVAAIVFVVAGCASGPQTRAGCENPNYGAAVIGGLAGGLLGAQVGSGSGRIAATAVGAGTGAVVGSQVNCD